MSMKKLGPRGAIPLFRFTNKTLLTAFLVLCALTLLFSGIRSIQYSHEAEDFFIGGTPLRSADIEGSTIGKTEIVTISPPSITSSPTIECRCQLLSVDCLDSIRCMGDKESRARAIILGIETRNAIRANATFVRSGVLDRTPGWTPLGKSFQYRAIASYEALIQRNWLPVSHRSASAFVEEDRYIDCQINQLKGLNCFLRNMNEAEDVDQIEKDALQLMEDNQNSNKAVSEKLSDVAKKDLQTFLSTARHNRNKDRDMKFDKGRYSKNDGNIQESSALRHILFFAHLVRMSFNRQPTVFEFYSNNLKHITPPTIHAPTNNKSDKNMLSPFRVSVHIRRGDACQMRKKGYETVQSPLDSPAQVGGNRKCYATSVYMDALRRVKKMLTENWYSREGDGGNENNIGTLQPPSLEVYLATDHLDSLLEEIRIDHNDLYDSVSWKFLDYSRAHFNYKGGSIEQSKNENKGMLGETAVADLWLLSHGTIHIGHLGSRFGKIAWLLSTARHNDFIPFFSVDGKSFCCEIDEDCQKMSPYVNDMTNCLTYAHELSSFKNGPSYWTRGSESRRMKFESDETKKNSSKIFGD